MPRAHDHARPSDRDRAALDATVSTRLAATGQRYTPNRRLLVDALVAAEGPLTLPDVLAACAGLAQSSAYRGLGALEEAGVVHRLSSSDEFARFELAEELTGHHHHLICSSCGAVADFTVPGELEASLDAALARAARKAGFEPDRHRLDLVGRCRVCA